VSSSDEFADAREEVAAMPDQVRARRDEIGDILDELDRRRRELLDWRLQIRRHSKVLVAIGAIACGAIGLAVWRHYVQRRPVSRFQRFRNSLARVIRGPGVDPAEAGAAAAGFAANRAAGGLAQGLARRVFTPWRS
jgi:hypothetical protein